MKNKVNVRVTEVGAQTLTDDESKNTRYLTLEKFKKPILYLLMTIVFAGCMYMIFKPKKETKISDNGFNSAVPQASNDKLQSDKQKAYEQQLLDEKNEEKRIAVTSLSDYWNNDASSGYSSTAGPVQYNANGAKGLSADQKAIGSYYTAQQTLGSFYERDGQEVNHLKKEITRLKNEISQKETVNPETHIEDQLQLMEKSYQMAAKYLPMPVKKEEYDDKEPIKDEPVSKEDQIIAIQSRKRNVVSGLYKKSNNSFLNGPDQNTFIDINSKAVNNGALYRNSIPAIVYETKTVTSGSMISLRLEEPMMLGKILIPDGTVLKASVKFQDGRLELKISMIEYKGNIYPVDINIHDNDGQLGLYVPNSPERNAVTDMVSNMSQSSGTNIMMTQSAGQQIAADLSKGVIQGVSGYFSKKVRIPKVTIKAGHQVYLVSKK